MKDGKPVLLYFSDLPAVLDTVDIDQLQALRAFRRECQQEGIVFGYDSLDALERLMRRHLNRLVRDRFGVAVSDQARPARGAQVVARVEREQRVKTDSRGRLTESTQRFLVLENRGVVDAHDVEYRVLPEEIEGFVPGRDPQFLQGGPIRHLLAGREVRFLMLVSMNTRPQFELEISWREEGDDQRKSITQTITV